MDKQILLGTITLEQDTVMMNLSFQYAASFEELTVPKGEYPIYTYASDMRTDKNGVKEVGCAYYGFKGIVLRGNVGGKPGETTYYSPYQRGYSLAEELISGHVYFNKIDRADLELRPEWGIEISDFISSFDNKRCFSLGIVLKDGAEITYAE